ncbi:calcium-activated chloride channel regulator 1-like [Stegodyphus dumicola]|uniref:calcium-activated chloride channel regulator 1-like n=1 Tax=Stegodyphus dumicola TaxID=202533 RepID=UPI0015B0579E|nr:calcium-activated chloride channel regulator 1-like [Stegodyphus dumicola]
MDVFHINLFLLLSQSMLISSSLIHLDGNGYKGIVVAIHGSVPENGKIVQNIKTLFSKASEYLYNSTRNGVYFKEVTIVVPSTWSKQPEYEIQQGNFFSTAHVRVDNENPEYKDTPYTLQPGGCGDPGHYIHLTPWFLEELEGKTVEMFGAPERQLVHEWAHLRYGVFDEYGIPGDKRYPMFYHENNKIRPTSCVRDIKGWIESRDGGPCSITTNGDVDTDCIFIPNMHSNEAKASIMYMPFIPSMEGFCDDDTHKHNMFAPTKHNAMCNYRSTWDVISNHPDFQTLRAKRDTSSEFSDTLFRILQSPKSANSRYVLVLDISGSMNGQPMKLLHSAATRLIEDRVPDGTRLGIVEFSSTARILNNLTEVNNVTRDQLSRNLPAKDDGGLTAIGKALEKAIQVLTNDNGTAEGGLIMLITDGEENVEPFIQDILPGILKHNVVINAVAFGSNASEKLENMTMVTGGRGYFFAYDGKRSSYALDSAFLESITSQADVELQPVQLKDEMFDLDEAVITKYVYIDEELGKDTVFTVMSSHIERVGDLILRSPSGTLYDHTYQQYDRDDRSRQRIRISVPESEAGKWEAIIRRRGDSSIQVNFAVTSEPKDVRDQPIRVRSWMNEIQLQFPAYAKVYAEVKKGYMAVIGATVLATIERPMGSPVDIELHDNGVGADATEDDGIYSGYFTYFNGNGRYAVIARVTNDGQARLKTGSKASAAPAMPIRKGRSKDTPVGEFLPEDFEITEKNETANETGENYEAAKKFDRVSNAGAFRVQAWKEDAGDVIPPGDITDLTVISIFKFSKNEDKVTLQFTAPGNDMDAGQVSSLEIRASKNQEELIANFENGENISDVYYNSPYPPPPGENTLVTITVPEVLRGNDSEAWTIYFAMKARDEAGGISSGFNIAAATFGINKKNHSRRTEDKHGGEEEMLEESLNTSETEKNSDSSSDSGQNGNISSSSFHWWPVAVTTGVVLIIVMIAALITVVILKRNKMKTYFSVQSAQC